MQFHKIINPETPEYQNNGVHHWLWSGNENKIDLSIYLEKLIFSKFIHNSQKSNFTKASNNFISDSAASTIRRLYEKEFINERLVYEGLRCCQSIIFNYGYQDFVLDGSSFKKLRGQDNIKNIMIIPGCQHPGMLTGRVKKAVNLIHFFDKNLKIIASGCNPLNNPTGPDKVTIPDESKFIINKLNDLINELNITCPPNFEISEESKSFDTVGNIVNSINSLEKVSEHNIIIVSSTFQLIKLSKSLEIALTNYYRKSENYAEVNTELLKHENENSKKFIKNIFLFGAEKEGAKFTPTKSSGYVKSMFVDIYNELIEYEKNQTIINNIKNAISLNGYAILKKGGTNTIKCIKQCLGDVIQQQDIKVEEDSKKWATKTNAMPLHTDHSNADFIAWHCIEQTDNGGESLLSNITNAFEELNESQKNVLNVLQIQNVIKFDGDTDFYPLIIEKNETKRFYFVPWLIKTDESDEVKNAISDLEKILDKNKIIIRLEKDDVLVIDNKKIVHGRNEILGTKNRLLRRYWIKSKK